MPTADPAQSPLYNGERTALREDISRFTSQEDASGVTATRTYTGTWPEALALAPKRGQVMTDLPHNPIIEAVTANRPAPLVCEIIVTARREFSGSTTEGEGPEGDQPVYEVEWTRNDKTLETNKLFAPNIQTKVTLDPSTDTTLAETSKGGKLSQPLFAKVEATMGEWIQMLKTMPWTDRNVVIESIKKANSSVAASIVQFFAKFSRGTDSYLTPIPVVRVTTRAREKPLTTTMGKRTKPPAESGYPKGYDWLGTADSATRQGKNGLWVRRREWTGVPTDGPDKGWDKELYP